MNRARTTYQSDYTLFDWQQNNFSTDINEFCCSENIDECLKYISQEFCALGYPSIYTNSNDCPLAVNCDIVKLLNVTFELLRNCNEQSQNKEDLENRNQRLSVDLNILTKKNSQLKDTIEQNERKLAAVLERERQLKVKNEQISNLLKAEKDETKKLTAQIRQQKVAFQHEIRKYENNMNHIKSKLNQLLSDKNSNKKMVSMSTSHSLQSRQRGKWKSGPAVNTALEEMYNSLISQSDTRFSDLCKEKNSYHLLLQFILSEVLDVVSCFQDELDVSKNCCILEAILKVPGQSQCIQYYEDKFKILFSFLKTVASGKMKNRNESSEDEVALLRSKISDYEKIIAKYKESHQTSESQKNMADLIINKEDRTKLTDVESFKKDKEKLAKEKQILAKSLANMEKERAELSAQKLAVLRLAMQQRIPPSGWHQSLGVVPSVTVITSPGGVSSIPDMNQLKLCSSSPNQTGQSLSPIFTLNEAVTRTICASKSDSVLLTEGKSSNSISSPQNESIKLDSNLPSWVAKASKMPNIITEGCQSIISETSQNLAEEDLCIPSEPSSEEIQLSRLKAAVEDIEQRRHNIS